MPLSEPAARQPLHNRQYDFRGYRREDGLWDIEGRIVDTKTYAFENQHRGQIEAGTPVHDMQVRLTLDDDFLIRDIEAVTDASPFARARRAPFTTRSSRAAQPSVHSSAMGTRASP